MLPLFHCVEIDLVAEQAEDFVVFFKLFSSYLETCFFFAWKLVSLPCSNQTISSPWLKSTGSAD